MDGNRIYKPLDTQRRRGRARGRKLESQREELDVDGFSSESAVDDTLSSDSDSESGKRFLDDSPHVLSMDAVSKKERKCKTESNLFPGKSTSGCTDSDPTAAFSEDTKDTDFEPPGPLQGRKLNAQYTINYGSSAADLINPPF